MSKIDIVLPLTVEYQRCSNKKGSGLKSDPLFTPSRREDPSKISRVIRPNNPSGVRVVCWGHPTKMLHKTSPHRSN